MPRGGYVIMEQALGDMQKPLAGNSEFVECTVERFEVVPGGLVGLNILDGDDLVEGCVAAGEPFAVDVGQDDHL
jgi:hypothetical protein